MSLASHADLLRGGKSGAAIVPGDSAASLMLRKVSGERPAMPPVGEPLTAVQVALLERWIADGAPLGSEEGGAQDQTWWSFRKLERPPVPQPDSAWGSNEIDRFVATRLAKNGLEPVANRRTAAPSFVGSPSIFTACRHLRKKWMTSSATARRMHTSAW